MYAAVRVPLNYWNFSPDSLMVEDLTCEVYSAPKKSPGPSRCSHPGCTEKAKLFYSQVAGRECQVIYFSSSPYTPPPCHPPPTVQWGAETICELVVSVGSEKTKGLLDLRPPEVLSNLNYPRALWLYDPAFSRRGQGRLSPELSHGVLRLLPLLYFHHRVCECWRSLDGVLAPCKAALYIKVKGLSLTKVHSPKCWSMFLLEIPQVSADRGAAGQKVQMRICVAP